MTEQREPGSQHPAANTPRTAYTDEERETGQRFLAVMDGSTGNGINLGRAIRAAIEAEAAAPTPAEPLDVRLAVASAMAYQQTGSAWTDLGGNAQDWWLTEADHFLNRLAAARPDTPPPAEQPGLREALDVEHIEVTPHCTCMAYEGVYPHRAFCWLVKTGYAVEGSRQPLTTSPSPEPEGK